MAEAKAGQGSTSQKSAPKGEDAALQKKFYHDMLLIRRFEEKAGQLYGMGLIGGFCHLYSRSVVVGMQAALTEAIRSSLPIATRICW